jgi:hypothetical protein
VGTVGWGSGIFSPGFLSEPLRPFPTM